MNGAKPILLGLLAGLAVYFGLNTFIVTPSGQLARLAEDSESRLVTTPDAPTVSPVTSVTGSDKHGDKQSVTTVSPKLSPLSPSLSPTTTPSHSATPVPYTSVAPSHSPTPSPSHSATPVPYTSVNPSHSPTPTPTPSPTATPTPTPTPSQTPTPTATPTPAPTQEPSPTPAGSGHVIINEVGWMGTATSSNDEWLELYNEGSAAVDLSGWRLKADDGKPDIALSGAIAAGGYYLIERTDDDTIRDVAADLVTSFGTGLGNTGENLKLLDASGVVQDAVSCAGGWYGGDNATHASMERLDASGGDEASNWASNDSSVTIGHDAAGNPILGTPRGQNSVAR